MGLPAKSYIKISRYIKISMAMHSHHTKEGLASLALTIIILPVYVRQFRSESIKSHFSFCPTEVNAHRSIQAIGSCKMSHFLNFLLYAHANAVPHDPNAVPHDPNAVPHDPNAVPHDPNAVPHDPNAVPHDPNAVPHDPNAVSHDPNAVSHDPNAVSHDPNAVPHDPNAVPHDPNAVPHNNHMT